jgi:signal transduction histidine kinase/ActR/RegA family two-component response regulator
MRFFRRSLVALGVAATLPTVVFAAVGVFYLLHIERERVESETLATAETVTTFLESRVQRDLAALDVLTMSSTLNADTHAVFYRRGMRVLQSNPDWSRLKVIDPANEQEILTLPGDADPATEPLAAIHLDPVRQAERENVMTIGGVDRTEDPVIWIYAPVQRAPGVRFVLAVGVRTDVFQNILISGTPEESAAAAVVDRAGNFIARTLHYEERVGTPATEFVRGAIKKGSRGFYPGETYEGLKNYTAFHTSDVLGWSTHIAVASSLIDTPTAWSFAVAGFAGLGAVLLAIFLVVLVLRDMAERRRADEALRQSQKMEAVGQLTGGIAHDFNNLLTAIIGNLDMIQTRAAGNERLQRMAANALEAARRGAKLASQLLAFSRTQRLVVRRIDLQQLLNGMSGLLTQSVGPSVQVLVDIDANAKFVTSDANQLELALLNLAVNARDAMSGTGTLRIVARRAASVDKSLPAGDYVNICVIDTGTGMSEEIRARAIEPFFTTKATGQGTGLGLSQVYAVARESGGTLTLASEPGRGTTVCLMLRRARDDDTSPATRPSRLDLHVTEAALPDKKSRVLVVDDDRLVRKFMTESLRSMGHDVTDAAEGTAALEILDRHPFDLLLVDYAMPGMNGAAVARAAREKQPGLRILVVSGYSDSAALEAAIGSAAQLRKPFDLSELRAAVLDVLASELPPANASVTHDDVL